MLYLKKSFSLLAIEALVVAVTFGLTVVILKYIIGDLLGIFILAAIAGALLHLIFEVSRVNVWYSAKYCNMLSPAEMADAGVLF